MCKSLECPWIAIQTIIRVRWIKNGLWALLFFTQGVISHHMECVLLSCTPTNFCCKLYADLLHSLCQCATPQCLQCRPSHIFFTTLSHTLSLTLSASYTSHTLFPLSLSLCFCNTFPLFPGFPWWHPAVKMILSLNYHIKMTFLLPMNSPWCGVDSLAISVHFLHSPFIYAFSVPNLKFIYQFFSALPMLLVPFSRGSLRTELWNKFPWLIAGAISTDVQHSAQNDFFIRPWRNLYTDV